MVWKKTLGRFSCATFLVAGGYITEDDAKWNNVSAWSRKSVVGVKRKGERHPLPCFLPFYSRLRAFSISWIGLSRSLEQATQCFNWYPDTSKSVCAAPNFSTHFDNILMSDKTLRAVINILLIAQCKPRNTQDQPFLLVSWEPSVATYKGIHRWQGHLDRKKDHTATSHT